MKRLLLTFCLFVMAVCAMAQKVDLGKVIIDKDNCTITVKSSGKTFNLYGDVKVVESFPDLRVRIVTSHPDLEVKKVEYTPRNCGEFRFVDSFADFTIKFVDSFPDIEIRYVDSFPGINH